MEANYSDLATEVSSMESGAGIHTHGMHELIDGLIDRLID